MTTHTDTQSPTDRARHRFVDRCVEVANFMGDATVMELARTAAKRRGEPNVLWDALAYALNAWQRVALHGKPQEAATRWEQIVAAVESVECELCNGTGETCSECCESSESCGCGFPIRVPCSCKEATQ